MQQPESESQDRVTSSRVDPALLKAVVKLDAPATPNSNSVQGTGFIVSPAVTNAAGHRLIFIVTNKHIISDWTPADRDICSYRKSLSVTLYGGPGGAYTTIEVPLLDDSDRLLPSACRSHYDESVDVALVWLNRADVIGNTIFNYNIFDESYLIYFNNISSQLVGLGDQVFALGYPSGITSLTTSYPIAKSGYLSSNPGETLRLKLPFKNRAGDLRVPEFNGKLLIVDGLIVPGNSGGPVVLPSELKVRRHPTTNILEFSDKQQLNKCIGIVSFGIQQSGLTIVY